jgi:uncharacterized protein (TIGR02996 family)
VAQELDAYFQAVYDSPNDPAAKLVLADVLQERSDPRGELIALQLQPTRPKRIELRLEKLLERHRAEFLGPLNNVVKAEGQVWEHGFLVECRATLDGSTVHVPAWATVRKLALVGNAASLPTELACPHMRGLRELTNVDLQGLHVLFQSPTPSPLQALVIDGPGEAGDWPAFAIDLVREAKMLPRLTRLGLRFWRFEPEQLTWLWLAPVMARLKVLELSMPRIARNAVPLLDALRASQCPVDAVILRGRTLEMKIKREADWSVFTLRARTPMLEVAFGDAGAILESLPTLGVTRLDVTSEYPVTSAELARMKRVVKRFTSLEWVSWPETTR